MTRAVDYIDEKLEMEYFIESLSTMDSMTVTDILKARTLKEQ